MTAALNGEKILVTGATGQIAFPIASTLAAENEVWGLARLSRPEDRARLSEAGITPVACDLGDGDFTGVPTDFTYVVHLAAYQAPGWDYDAAIRANAEGTGLLLQHCRSAKGALVMSTHSVYRPQEDPRYVFTEESPLGECNSTHAPTYSVSKISQEATARLAARAFGVPVTIARMNASYGPNGGLPAMHIDALAEGRAITTRWDPCLYSPIYEDDINLQEGDVIIVSPYEALVKIEGNVKRPMKYEMKNDETIATLLKYAGNFSSDAYTRSMKLVRQNGKEYQIFTVDDMDYSVFKLKDGDVITAEAILNRYENKLEIKGAVYRPGIYQFGGELNTVKQLITKADGVMADAFLGRAVLHRQREDMTREIIQVDIKSILNGSKPDIALQRNDVLYIPSIHDLQDLGNIEVFGEVARPGKYIYADNMTLEDLIIQAGGLLESASTVKVDVSRRIKNNKSTEVSATIGEMYSFALKDGFVIDGEAGFVLEPYDQVYVRRSPGYQPQVNVTVEGEILYNGTYALTNKSERLSDLVKKAGGTTPYAYVKGAKLMRKANDEEIKRMEDVLKMMQREMGTAKVDSLILELDSTYSVGIDLQRALSQPGGDADIVLREGDQLIIPELTNTVKINGAVMMPNTVAFNKGKSTKYYIGQAGGYAMMLPREETYTSTKKELLERITGLLGGRVAEELIFNEVTTGAHNDFEKATKIARAMVTEYGMSDLGPVQLEQQEGGVFLGRDYNKSKNFYGGDNDAT